MLELTPCKQLPKCRLYNPAWRLFDANLHHVFFWQCGKADLSEAAAQQDMALQIQLHLQLRLAFQAQAGA